LAEKVGLAASPCLRRLKALEEDGIIEGYRALVNRKALGFEVEAFVFIKLVQSEPGWRTRLVDRLKGYEEVIACHALAGEVDLIVHVVAKDIEDFGEFTMNRVLTLPGVADVRSSFVLSTIKPQSAIPVPD
jgi:Lrp/AsnC family transcriptional regulator, leucine-responsive regulatory protein